jgi:hypothetical protein
MDKKLSISPASFTFVVFSYSLPALTISPPTQAQSGGQRDEGMFLADLLQHHRTLRLFDQE